MIVAGRSEPLDGTVLHLSVIGMTGLLAPDVLILVATKWMDRLGDRR